MHPRRVEATRRPLVVRNRHRRRNPETTRGLAADAVVVAVAAAAAERYRSGRRVFARLDPASSPSLGAGGDTRRRGLGRRRRASRAPRRIPEPRRATRVSHRFRPRGKPVVAPPPRKLRRDGAARLPADPSSRRRRRISRVRALRVLPRPGAILLPELADPLRSARHAKIRHASRERARGPSVGDAIRRVDATAAANFSRASASRLTSPRCNTPSRTCRPTAKCTTRKDTSRLARTRPGTVRWRCDPSRRRAARPSPIRFASTPAFASRRAGRGDAWSRCSAR